MNGFWDGDEWMHTDDDQPSRADMQARIDHQYAVGQLDVDQWRRGTEHLSTCDARVTMMVGVLGVRR